MEAEKRLVDSGAPSTAPAAILVQTSERSGWSGQLSAAAAILGVFFTLGQTASQAVQGYYQHKIELAKSNQDLELAKQKSDSELASSFLALILSKDTPEDKQSMLFDALSTLQTHPLNRWAKARHDAIETSLQQLGSARDAQLAAYQEKDDSLRRVLDLKAHIQQLSIQISLHREDTTLTERLHDEQLVIARELGVGIATQVRVETKVALITGEGAGPKPGRSSETELVSFHLPIDRIRTAWSVPIDRKLYDEYMPFIESALVEFKLTEKKTVAAILATAYHETASFKTIVEYGSGATYEGRKDLGNTEVGDGVRFKGRGIIEITGRANYARLSERLGLGTLLIDSPEDASKPEIASRAMCIFFKDQGVAFEQAAEQGDLEKIRRLVNGGLNGLQEFKTLYEEVLPVLTSEQPATVAPTSRQQ